MPITVDHSVFKQSLIKRCSMLQPPEGVLSLAKWQAFTTVALSCCLHANRYSGSSDRPRHNSDSAMQESDAMDGNDRDEFLRNKQPQEDVDLEGMYQWGRARMRSDRISL